MLIPSQVMANAFYPVYTTFVAAANSSSNGTYSTSKATSTGAEAIALLADLDAILTASGQAHFSLAAWIAEARSWTSPTTTLPTTSTNTSTVAQTASFYEYNARNQITLWGPTGEISDYASKQWGGLISSYYIPRWQLFFNVTVNGTTTANGANSALSSSLLAFEESWQLQTWGEALGESYAPPGQGELQRTIARVVKAWPSVFA